LCIRTVEERSLLFSRWIDIAPHIPFFKGGDILRNVDSSRQTPADPAQDTKRAMLARADGSGNLRDAALVSLWLSTGLDPSDLSRLNIADLYFEGEQAWLDVDGRRILLTSDTASRIQAYLEQRKDDHPPCFFPSEAEGWRPVTSGERWKNTSTNVHLIIASQKEEDKPWRIKITSGLPPWRSACWKPSCRPS